MPEVIPVCRVFDYDKAIDFYVNWMGFKIEWEERPDDGPFQIRLSLREISLHLVEMRDEGNLGTWAIITGFKNLVPYRKITSLKPSAYKMPVLKKVPREPNTLSMTVVDPFFNRIEFRETMR